MPRLARFQSMKQVSHNAEYWRERAREARAQAEQMSTPGAKRQLLEIAAAYEELAKLAADRPVGKIPGPTLSRDHLAQKNTWNVCLRRTLLRCRGRGRHAIQAA